MPAYRRAPAAVADLVDIWTYVARHNPGAADRLLTRIDATCRRLAGNPWLGRARPDLLPDVRSRSVGEYLIIYRPADGSIEVARVLHGARDIRSILGDKEP